MADQIKPEGTARQARAFDIYLPSILKTISDYTGPAAQSKFNANASIAPQQMSLDQALLQYFGPQYNEIGSQLQLQQAMNQAGNELQVLSGPGAGLVGAGKALQEMQDPEYFATRAAGAQKLQDLLAGQDPNKLTGAELTNIERGLNRTNSRAGIGMPTNTSAITNAQTFGAGLDAKRNTLLKTIDTIPQNLAAMKSGTDVFQVGTGRPSYGPNPGMGEFATGKSSSFLNDINGIASGLLGEAGSNVRQNNELTANKRDALDRANETTSALGNLST